MCELESLVVVLYEFSYALFLLQPCFDELGHRFLTAEQERMSLVAQLIQLLFCLAYLVVFRLHFFLQVDVVVVQLVLLIRKPWSWSVGKFIVELTSLRILLSEALTDR